MTREKAILHMALRREELKHSVSDLDEDIKAFDMAIKALEQKPCEDVISREDALKALCKAVHKNDDNIPCPNQRVSCLWNKTKVQDYAEEILKLPSATPQQKTGWWIEDAETYYKAIHVIGEPDENTPIFLDDIACSECLVKFSIRNNETERFKCCPNCGIKMEVEE